MGPAEASRNFEKFSVVPELNLKLGKQCGDWFRLWIGYDALYMQHMIRPAQQTTYTTLLTTVSVGATAENATLTQPTIRFHDMDVWVQGLNFGVDSRGAGNETPQGRELRPWTIPPPRRARWNR